MARYAVEFSPRAWRDLERLSPEVAERIARRTKELGNHPEPRGDTVKRLQGFGIPTYRFRVGDYRALFRVGMSVVRILRVVHRSELDRAVEDLR